MLGKRLMSITAQNQIHKVVPEMGELVNIAESSFGNTLTEMGVGERFAEL